MESRPGPRLRTSPPPDGFDLISSLPDEMLRLVIARIGCARSIIQTGLLSRRWRGLWTGLALRVVLNYQTIRDFTPALLAGPAVAPPVYALHIHLSNSTASDRIREVNSLLCTVALFSPPLSELAFTLTEYFVKYAIHPFDIELPCFHHFSLIELDTMSLPIRFPPTGEFTALQTLSLKGKIVDLGAMLDRCPRLRTLSLAFRGVMPYSVEATLSSLALTAPEVSVCLLDIHIHPQDRIGALRFSSLLRDAMRVSPKELVLTRDYGEGWTIDDLTLIDAQLPCFNRATSMEMSLHNVCFTQLSAGEFSALRKLSLSCCRIVDLATLVTRCPRLHVLTLVVSKSTSNVTIHSTTLQELNVYSYKECQSIDIVTPTLKQLVLDVRSYTDFSMSISAPTMEKVSWKRSYIGLASVFGFWCLRYLSLKTVHHLALSHVLCLHIYAHNSLGIELDFAEELEKIPVTEFSMLELHLKAMNHVSGALVSYLLGMHHIRTAMQRLTVILKHNFKATRECQNCPCDKPNDWRSHTINLTHLENVKIEGFNGEHRQLELLKLLLRCAPMLKTLNVMLAQKFRGSKLKDWRSRSNSLPHLEEVEIEAFSGEYGQHDLLKILLGCAPMLKTVTVRLACGINRENFRGGIRKINNIFAAHPSVNSYVYLYTGGLFRHAHA